VLCDEIAAGGMATVHFGRLLGAAGFSRTVAIKRLHPQFARDPDFVAMFVDEARLAARIRHPNVVPTLDVVATEGELFLVMDYVPGESLSRLQRGARGGVIPARIISAIFCGALHGLHAAHEATDEHGAPLGIVHRDMSPQNILVGDDGVARVLDFGVAMAAGRAQVTGPGKVKGKLGYLAPEQIHGHVTRQSDLFAVSAALWEALTGRRLFVGDDPRQVVAKILLGEITPPTKYAGHLPAGIDAVVMRGLERDPQRRYATAREMAGELESCLGMASSTQVGAWVDSVAHEALVRRATALSGIESSSASISGAALLADDRPSSPAARSRVSLLSSTDGHSFASSSGFGRPSWQPGPQGTAGLRPDPGRTGRRFAWAVGVALALGGGTGIFMANHPSRDVRLSPQPPAPARSASPLAVRLAPLTERSLAMPVPSAETAPLPSAPGGPGAGARGAGGAGGEVGSPRQAKAPAAPTSVKPAPAAALNCDPPYSLDGLGHKIWKDECFRKPPP
jgi:serine/threonine-protein kinase